MSEPENGRYGARLRPPRRGAIMDIDFDMLAKFLLLPKDVVITDMTRDLARNVGLYARSVTLRIEGPSLPEIHEGDKLPRANAMYRQVGDRVEFIDFGLPEVRSDD